MGVVFSAGYAGIVVEEALGLSKAAIALLLAAALWSIRAAAVGVPALDAELSAALGDVGGVVFFLLGAMAVVEVVDSHQGFKVITDAIRPSSRQQLLVSVALATFFLSSVLDNLTTTLVMVSLLNKLCPDPEARRFLGAAVVVAANAGGAWTPIGDVTTTMLWIGGQLSPLPTMRDLFLPAALSAALPVGVWALTAPEIAGRRELPAPEEDGLSDSGRFSSPNSSDGTTPILVTAAGATAEAAAVTAAAAAAAPPRGQLVACVGGGALLAVPLLRAWAGLPPWLAMLAGLGVLWAVTDALHWGEEDRRHLTVSQALRRLDSEAVLFFAGVLTAVAALEAGGLLRGAAEAAAAWVPSEELVACLLGAASALVDNVPLVAAAQGMYDMAQHPQDSSLWQLVAYCAGTGGSLLVIGSAAGVALLGLERGVGVGWWAARVTPAATAGYLAGLGLYLAQRQLFAGL